MVIAWIRGLSWLIVGPVAGLAFFVVFRRFHVGEFLLFFFIFSGVCWIAYLFFFFFLVHLVRVRE